VKTALRLQLGAMLLVAFASPVYAFDVDGGFGEPGCCGGAVGLLGYFGTGGGDDCIECLPEPLRESAKPLAESYRKSDVETLLGQRYEGALCTHHPCGAFNEDTASDFLDDMISEFRREQDLRLAKWGLAAGIGGLFVAVLALLESWRSNARGRRAEERIVRNETKLETLEKASQ